MNLNFGDKPMKTEKELDNGEIQDAIKVEEETANDISEEEEGEYRGRNWNQLLIGIVFVLAVVILWYVLTR